MIQESEDGEKRDYYSGYYFGNNPYSSENLPGEEDDKSIQKKIEEDLKKNTFLKNSNIQVKVTNGLAILQGSVETIKQKELSGKIAWDVKGVIEVLDELKVNNPETAGI